MDMEYSETSYDESLRSSKTAMNQTKLAGIVYLITTIP